MKLFKKLFKLTKSSRKNSRISWGGRKASLGRGLKGWVFSLVIALGGVLIFTLGWYILRPRYGFYVGKPAAFTYAAVADMRYVDSEGTGALQAAVSNSVAGVVVRDPSKIRTFLQEAQEGASQGVLPLFEGLEPDVLGLVNHLPLDERSAVAQQTVSLGALMLEEGIFGERDMEQFLWDHLQQTPLSWSQQNLVVEVLYGVFLGSHREDPVLTNKLRQTLSLHVAPVVRTLYRGDTIVEEGAIIAPFTAKILRLQGYREACFPWKYVLFLGGMLLCWGRWTLLSLSSGEKHQPLTPLLVGTLILTGWIGEIPARWFDVSGLGTLVLGGWGFLLLPNSMALPFVLGSGLLGVLIGGAPFITWQFAPFLVVAVVAYGGAFLLKDIRVKKRYWVHFSFVGVLAILAVLGSQWADGGSMDPFFALRFAFGMLFSGVLVWLGFPLGERFFNVLSPLRLTELSNPSSPLLKRLQIEAPGTYHHSLMVGTLAEIAAENIGMDGALVKAGALYHDVGKLRRPQFFIENQQYGSMNAHDELSPTLSALIIISHVRDGCELSGEYGIPQQIRRFILEHHGTTCLQYFQKRAESLGERVSREQFSYPGPAPRSKETALVMLADSVEAAIRADAGRGLRVSELENTIHGVVANKIKEKQLEDVDFTFRELEIIKKSFMGVLRSMYHSREIDKPKVVGELEEKRDLKDGKVPLEEKDSG